MDELYARDFGSWGLITVYSKHCSFLATDQINAQILVL